MLCALRIHLKIAGAEKTINLCCDDFVTMNFSSEIIKAGYKGRVNISYPCCCLVILSLQILLSPEYAVSLSEVRWIPEDLCHKSAFLLRRLSVCMGTGIPILVKGSLYCHAMVQFIHVHVAKSLFFKNENFLMQEKHWMNGRDSINWLHNRLCVSWFCQELLI